MGLVASKPAPRVLLLTGAGTEVYAGSDATYAGSLLKKLGATNVLGAAPTGAPIAGFGVVEVSQVATTNPDVILIIPSGTGGLADEIQSSPLWAGVPAVKNGRVFEVDRQVYLRAPGPRVAGALEELAALLYP
jgi:iron complex transport system substrate-binding protein